jgi:hypothetical protein
MPKSSSTDAAAARVLADCRSSLGLSETTPMQRIDRRLFLDAREVPYDQLAGLVSRLFELPEKPLVVVVFADISGLDWGQANACNDAVVEAGGILVDLGQYDFASAVHKWSGEGRTRPLPAIHSDLPHRTGPADWSPYKSAFLSEAEFNELQRQIREHRDDGSVIS